MRRTSACCPATRRFRSSGACPAWSSRKEKSASWAKRSSGPTSTAVRCSERTPARPSTFWRPTTWSSIQVYDELPEEERLKGNKNGKKRTGTNLVTRSKPEKSVNVEALAGYGADIDRGPDGHRKGRYGAGASYNYFSERRIYSVEANSNNNNQSSNRIRDRFASYAGGGDGDRRGRATLGASLTHRYGKHPTLSGNYRFANERSETQRITQQIYFPSEAYRSRSYTDTTRAFRASADNTRPISICAITRRTTTSSSRPVSNTPTTSRTAIGEPATSSTAKRPTASARRSATARRAATCPAG